MYSESDRRSPARIREGAGRYREETGATDQRRSPAKLRKRPAPEKWSAAEILAHLADAEIVASWRLRSILGAPGTPIQAFDQDAWVAAGQYGKRDARKSLEQFRVLRDANLALYKSLTPQQWKHHGIHAERGVESIERLASNDGRARHQPPGASRRNPLLQKSTSNSERRRIA